MHSSHARISHFPDSAILPFCFRSKMAYKMAPKWPRSWTKTPPVSRPFKLGRFPYRSVPPFMEFPKLGGFPQIPSNNLQYPLNPIPQTVSSASQLPESVGVAIKPHGRGSFLIVAGRYGKRPSSRKRPRSHRNLRNRCPGVKTTFREPGMYYYAPKGPPD
jgi:hypothetical protein